MVSLLVSIYYNVIIAWILFYLFASFRSDVPWRSCDPAWASKECREEYHISGNGSLYNATTDTVSCLAGFNPVFKNVTVSVGRNISVLAQCVSTVDISKRISPSDDYFKYVLFSKFFHFLVISYCPFYISYILSQKSKIRSS